MNIPTFDDKTFESKYTVVGLKNLNDENITSMEQLYEFIENILAEIIEIIVKIALQDLIIDQRDFRFVIIGGKAVNKIIKLEYIPRSFDYDIHILGNDEDDLNTFGSVLERSMNNLLTVENNFYIFRYYIFNILLKHGLVTDEHLDHYLNNDLFYFAQRDKGNFSIKGIFIHLVLKPYLANEQTYTNVKINERHLYHENSLMFNISDIDFDSNLQYGTISLDSNYQNIYTDSYDELYYGNYISILNNLLKMISLRSFKRTKNRDRFILFTDIDKYTCSFLSRNTYNDLHNYNKNTVYESTKDGSFTNRFNDTKMMINRDGEYNIFNLPSKRDIINSVLVKYGYLRDVYLRQCRNSIILDSKNQNKNNIFVTNRQSLNTNHFLRLFEDYDNNRYIKYYTDNLYSVVNYYCQYEHYDIGNIIQNRYHEGNLRDIVVQMDNNIRNMREQMTINGYDELFKDEFFVYRIQNFVSINDNNGNIFSTDYLNTNSIIYMPSFLSTSYSTSYNYYHFVNDNSFVLKIKINKNSRKWLFIDSYSYFPNENEILIDRNSYLIVTKIEYKTITMYNEDIFKDVKVVHATLVDDIDDIQDYILEQIKRDNDENKDNKTEQIDNKLGDYTFKLHNFTERTFETLRQLFDNKLFIQDGGKINISNKMNIPSYSSISRLESKNRINFENNYSILFDITSPNSYKSTLAFDINLYSIIYRDFLNNTKLFRNTESFSTLFDENILNKNIIKKGIQNKQIEQNKQYDIRNKSLRDNIISMDVDRIFDFNI